ncbi:hypothetical protein [Paenibacillus hamazuiensis]|uniref:hypothetical protein n=1 Tax=Paenibacillus hamazuiensis TaxID=2936508 RepID=UPI00200C606D|nr:hypothetical protein [Paenibacillus hamazuiensis]
MKAMEIRHRRENGKEIVAVHTPDGSEYRIARWPIIPILTELEAAIDALWSGYEDAIEYMDDFDAELVTFKSEVPGAATAIIQKIEEAGLGCRA